MEQRQLLEQRMLQLFGVAVAPTSNGNGTNQGPALNSASAGTSQGPPPDNQVGTGDTRTQTNNGELCVVVIW